jgi:DeoR family transcriptional regulator of aga operon
MREEKARIAALAASRVADGSSLALTGGTTTSEVARRLVDRDRLTIVTNAINIASEIAVRPNLRLILTGGVARGASYELVGPLAERGLEGIHVDTAFVGVDGIAPPGLTTHDDVEAQTNRALIDHAARAVVVADASKIGAVALARICELDRVDELITDGGADPRLLEQIAARGVTVTTA